MDQEFTTEHQQIIDAMNEKTESLETQHQLAADYLSEIETLLDNWQSMASSPAFNVMDNIEEEDQEWHVTELIMIDRSIGKLVLLIEKIDLLIDKNERMMNRAQLKIKSEQLQLQSERLQEQIESHKLQAYKIEGKIQGQSASLHKSNRGGQISRGTSRNSESFIRHSRSSDNSETVMIMAKNLDELNDVI